MGRQDSCTLGELLVIQELERGGTQGDDALTIVSATRVLRQKNWKCYVGSDRLPPVLCRNNLRTAPREASQAGPGPRTICHMRYHRLVTLAKYTIDTV
jgi:hypothetical protein